MTSLYAQIALSVCCIINVLIHGITLTKLKDEKAKSTTEIHFNIWLAASILSILIMTTK